ncbi:YbfB/YjiJ family MFS transporter, partial [Corynebacterium sp. KPL1855]|uniref:YbfB/YjiJ family MFS transporter n=1 Tax=Corynebacterium sp. KPL1855 TaxID=1203562 RepID=UPI0012ECAD09
ASTNTYKPSPTHKQLDTLLLGCYTLQVAGAIAATFGNSTVLLMVAAILFGATFMGITMLTISTGVAYRINGGAARLTTWYSLGQVVGPAAIGVLLSNSIRISFIIATIAIIIGMATIKVSRL